MTGHPAFGHEAAAALRRVEESEGPAPREGPVRVLVVDDDRVDRMAVSRGLRSGGHDLLVTEAQSCAEARERLATQEFDCVFLDFLLPDGTGLDFVREARKTGIRTPILILTGQGDEQVAVDLMQAGASDYLSKTYATPERLSQSLRNALRLHAAERQAALAERERQRLHVLERLARDQAQTAQRRMAFLAEASALVSASLDYETTLENVARLAVPDLADWCFVDLLQEDGGFARMAVANADPANAALARRLRRSYAGMPGAPHGISRVIATAQPEIMTEMPDWVLVSLARDAEHLELLRSLSIRSAMCVPLVARGRTLGAMTFISCRAEERYSLDDLGFAEEIARRAALAVDNARLYRELKSGEVRLRHQLDFTRAIADSLTEGVCAVDAEGRFTFANRAAESILAVPARDLLGRRLHEVVHARRPEGTAAPADECALCRAVTQGQVYRSAQDAFSRGDGAFVAVSYVTSPIVTGGRAVGSVLAFHDITERLRAEAELEESRRQLALNEKLSALGTLVSGVAHELRTPLTYLTNNIFLMQTRLEEAARRDPALQPALADVLRFGQAALEGVDRINSLVRDLRPFANPEGGRRAVAGLHEVVAGAVDLFRATQRGHIDVEADLQATPPLHLDRGQIQRVVINLLVNAADAMPHGGTLRVRTFAADGGGVLEVQDEGPGIPPDVQARMFDPFFSTKAEGTGLGLSITRRIVEAHGGSIRYATRLGQGTTFHVAFPSGERQPVPGEAWDLLSRQPASPRT